MLLRNEPNDEKVVQLSTTKHTDTMLREKLCELREAVTLLCTMAEARDPLLDEYVDFIAAAGKALHSASELAAVSSIRRRPDGLETVLKNMGDFYRSGKTLADLPEQTMTLPGEPT